MSRVYFNKVGKKRLEDCRIVVNCLALLLLNSRGPVEMVRAEPGLDEKILILADYLTRDQIDKIINLIMHVPIQATELEMAFETAKIRCHS